MEAIFDAIADVYRGVFGSRLVGIAVHGSAVTGDAFPGLSDVDFVVVLDTPLSLDEAQAIAERIDFVEIGLFAYVQATYHVAAGPVPSVVPGAFALVHGVVDDGFLHTNVSLRSAGQRWLRDLPGLLDQDMMDWSVSVARRARQLRLILTRVKPTVRAYLVTLGDEPIECYRNPWPILIERLGIYEPSLGSDLSLLVRRLEAGDTDFLSLGGQALRLLSRFDLGAR